MFSEGVSLYDPDYYSINGQQMMDFHSYIKLRPVLIILSFTFLTACSPSLNVSNGPASYDGVAPNSMTIVPNQLPVPASFKSVQFYANDASGKAPIIELNSTDHLTLSFDELTDIIGQFRITFSHHDKTWNYSNIPQDWYLKGIGELIVGGGQKSNSRGPDYIHYEIKIPQNKVQFISSGNYLLHVSDANSGQHYFHCPFMSLKMQVNLVQLHKHFLIQAVGFRPSIGYSVTTPIQIL